MLLPRPSPWWLKLTTAAYALVFAGFIWRADSGQLPAWAMRLYEHPLGDDLAHFGLAAGLSTLLGCVFADRKVRILGRSLPAGPSGALLVLGLEELSQVFFDTRQCSQYDLLSTTLGVLAGALVSTRLARL